MKRTLLLLAISGIFSLILIQCKSGDAKDANQTQAMGTNKCLNCHTDQAKLKSLAGNETMSPAGMDMHFKTRPAWEKVYLGGDGFNSFKKSGHGRLGCVYCHNGNPQSDDMKEAHGGEFIAHPSDKPSEKCAYCHSKIVNSHKNSLHNMGWGMKRKVAKRAGYENSDDFEKLSPAHKEGYNKNCASCHAQCGDCHVDKPMADGGGLANGHAFFKPTEETCMSCHRSRSGHDFTGQGGGQPDVHLTNAGMNCLGCHNQRVIHGDGKKYEDRWHVPDSPKCSDCHGDVAVDAPNNYHKMHAKDFSCYICHSQPYNNCAGCHAGDPKQVPQYQGFKIALNPMPELKKFKYALVRKTQVVPDTWKNYGVPELAAFNKLPTYSYASPHNIQRWTKFTKVNEGQACFRNCHLLNDEDRLRNKEIYLFESDLEAYEKEATRRITVDNDLPKTWRIK